MTYSKAKLKTNDDKASPCFKPFLIATYQTNVCLPGPCYKFHLDIFWLALPIQRDAKLNKKIVQDLPPDWIICFLCLQITDAQPHCIPIFFSSLWWMQNIWSVVNLLCRNPHWWSPVISSAYGVNLDRRMFDRIFCVVDKGDMPR
jgi:hypothetical protein